MPRPAGIRQKRVAERLQVALSELLQTEIADPGLAFVVVTRVNVDRELDFANIWVCTLDGDSEREPEVMAAVARAQGFIRRELASRLRLRRMPQLIFHWDPAPEQAARVDQLIDSWQRSDEETSPPESEASGDADP